MHIALILINISGKTVDLEKITTILTVGFITLFSLLILSLINAYRLKTKNKSLENKIEELKSIKKAN